MSNFGPSDNQVNTNGDLSADLFLYRLVIHSLKSSGWKPLHNDHPFTTATKYCPNLVVGVGGGPVPGVQKVRAKDRRCVKERRKEETEEE